MSRSSQQTARVPTKAIQRETLLSPRGLKSETRIEELDGLRGIAILSVVLYHFFGVVGTVPGSLPAYLARFFIPLASGVDLFFVLSGFLIAGILLDRKSSPNYFKAFYLRRVTRTFPLYFAILIPFASVVITHHFEGDSTLARLFQKQAPLGSNFLFLQNFWMGLDGNIGNGILTCTWSLAVEEQCYFIFPWITRLLSRGLFPLFAIGMALVNIAVRIIVSINNPTYALSFLRSDAIFLGALAAWCYRRAATWNWIENRRPQIFAGIALTSVFLLVQIPPRLTLALDSHGLYKVLRYSGIAAFYFFLLIAVLTRTSLALTWVTRFSFLRASGKLCYGIYLFHQVIDEILFAVVKHHPPTLESASDYALTLGAVALTFGIAQLSWTYFESPLIRLGHSVSYEG